MTCISLFDYTGNWSKPYEENGYNVVRVDIKNGIDILEWDYTGIKDVQIIIGAIPCTDYALCGSKFFSNKDSNGTTHLSNGLVNKTKEIINYFITINPNLIYGLENPKSRIHKLNKWMGNPRLKFNPCDYAGWDPIPENSRYNKETWIWGNFNIPEIKYCPPLQKEYPGYTNLGGKSEKTKELRSITPLGFAYAFYAANNFKVIKYSML